MAAYTNSPSYNYKQPRSINFVTILMLLGAAGVVYAAMKFGPPYWQAYKVDQILNDETNVASDLSMLNPQARKDGENKVLSDALARIAELGIDDPKLMIWIDPSFASIHADYTVVVKHPFGKTTTLVFHEKANIPTARRL